VATNIAGSL